MFTLSTLNLAKVSAFHLVSCHITFRLSLVRVPAWGPLQHVTPPLSQPVSCRVFSCSVNKTKKYILYNRKTLLMELDGD